MLLLVVLGFSSQVFLKMLMFLVVKIVRQLMTIVSWLIRFGLSKKNTIASNGLVILRMLRSIGDIVSHLRTVTKLSLITMRVIVPWMIWLSISNQLVTRMMSAFVHWGVKSIIKSLTPLIQLIHSQQKNWW